MSQGFKPLLASPVEFDHLRFDNLWVSPKFDGIRALVIKGKVVSRNLKPIPNQRVQDLFCHLEGYDGELIVGEPTAKDCYRVTNSGVMSKDGSPDVRFFAFDRHDRPGIEYRYRFEMLQNDLNVTRVDQTPVGDAHDLLLIEQRLLDYGYEGLMLRAFRGPASFYKYGRSTAKEGTLLKLKRFTDKEAVIVGVQELMKNGNEATKNALGRTERSSHQANLMPMGTLGALLCRTDDGIEFAIGTGFDQRTRDLLWQDRQSLTGSLCKFKSFDIGVKEAPRFPVFLGLRASIDA